jgi:Tfp pilus assembly protein PilN
MRSGATAAECLAGAGHHSCLLALGRGACFLKEVAAPKIPDSELRRVLALQMDQHFPFAAHEAAFSFRRLGDGAEGARLQVAAVKADLLAQALDELSAAGMKVESAAASAHSAEALGAKSVVAVESADGRLLIDVVKDGAVVYSREAQDPGTEEGRAAQVARTLAAAGLVDVPVMALGGLDALAGGSARPEKGLALLASAPPAFALEHPRVERDRQARAVNWRFFAAGGLMVAAVLASVLVIGDRLSRQAELDRTAQRRQVQIDQIQKSSREVEEKIKAYEEGGEALQAAFVPAQHPSDVLAVTSNALPAGAWLTGLTFERGKPFQIRGVSKTQAEVGQFVSNLNSSGRLRDVKLNFANEGKIDEAKVFQFSITAHVIGNLPLVEQERGSVRSAGAAPSAARRSS